MAFVAFAGLLVISSFHRLVANLVVLRCFGSHVGVAEEVETQLGDFGRLPSHHHPRFGVLLAPQDEVCRCLWWCAAAAASSVFDVAGGDFAEVAS